MYGFGLIGVVIVSGILYKDKIRSDVLVFDRGRTRNALKLNAPTNGDERRDSCAA